MKKRLIGIIIFLFCSSGIAFATPCPECPEGCVPFAAVATLRPEPIGTVASCPKGCIAIAKVNSVYERPLCDESTSAEASSPDVMEKEEVLKFVEMARQEKSTYLTRTGSSGSYNRRGENRIILSKTAFGLRKGNTDVIGFGLGIWKVDHGLTDYLELNFATVLPVFLFGVAAGATLHKEVTNYFAIGAHVQCGPMGMFVLGDGLFWGCNPAGRMSFRPAENHILNVGLFTSLVGYTNKKRDILSRIYMHPTLGYRSAFSRIWSFQTELILPIIMRKEDDSATYSDDRRIRDWFALWMYGFRVHGELLFGDFGFVIPFGNFYKTLSHYCPLGIPYFTLGFNF